MKGQILLGLLCVVLLGCIVVYAHRSYHSVERPTTKEIEVRGHKFWRIEYPGGSFAPVHSPECPCGR